MTVTLRESGVIEPEHRLSITPPISGRVDTIEVVNGTEVKQGQVLALMSSTDRAALIDSARAAGGKEYSFWEKVYKPAPLLAPLDGRIIAIDVVPGEVVVAAQAIFVMSDHLIAQANVDETDLEHIWVGQKCDITLEGFPDAAITGTVNQIAYDATTVNNVTTYLVNIYLDKTPKFVVSGLSADIFFRVSDRKNVLRIPTDALTPDGQVLVVNGAGHQAGLRQIQAGATDGTYTEVLSGLNEGDWIARQQFALQKVDNSGFSFMPGHNHASPLTPKAPSMIVLENVRKTYQMGDNVVMALRGVSLRIEQGEFVSLIGASGSGKSTLLHAIGLLDRPDGGTLSIAGRDVSRLTDEELSQLRSETIGFVFQQFHLLKRLNAFENVELPLIYAKGARASSDPADLLTRVGLGPRMHHKPNELSGGQQQRVAIARALIRRPGLILADEPTGNLDSQSGKEIMALLRELHAEGLTVVLVTHEPSIAANADRTIRVHDGQIVEDVRKPGVTLPVKPDESLRAHELEASRKFERDLLLLNLRQAARGLWANKLRTCLSALGIIIGVAAVIIMLALGRQRAEFGEEADRGARLEPADDPAPAAEHGRCSPAARRRQPPDRG